MLPSGSESVAVMELPTCGEVVDSDTLPASSTLDTDTSTSTLADSDPSETSYGYVIAAFGLVIGRAAKV